MVRRTEGGKEGGREGGQDVPTSCVDEDGACPTPVEGEECRPSFIPQTKTHDTSMPSFPHSLPPPLLLLHLILFLHACLLLRHLSLPPPHPSWVMRNVDPPLLPSLPPSLPPSLLAQHADLPLKYVPSSSS